MMTIEKSIHDTLNQLYPGRVIVPQGVNAIPDKKYMAYVLIHDGAPIVVGHGKKNRATIIFDNLIRKTPTHMKALLVRVYNIYYQSGFERFIIQCSSKDEAKEIEKNLHNKIGGNSCELPETLSSYVFKDVKNDFAILFLKLALCSYYDGLDDLKKWRRKQLIDDQTWEILSNKLYLKNLNWK